MSFAAGDDAHPGVWASHGLRYSVVVDGPSATLRMNGKARSPQQIRMELQGTLPDIHTAGDSPLPGRTNYLLGNKPAGWRRGLKNYSRLHQAGVFPGVDLTYYGNERQLEYDFVVAPHADPMAIRFKLDGADPELAENGDLIVGSDNQQVRFRKPVAYQELEGRRVPVAANFAVAANRTISFKLGSYDRERTLVIDPVILYASYFGGNLYDYITAITADATGAIYLTGYTNSANVMGTNGAYQTSSNGQQEAFVAKVAPDGSSLIYLTLLGGFNNDQGNALAVDAAENVYVAGTTYSNNFPVTADAYQSKCAQVQGCDTSPEVFITKLDPTGSKLLYSTYFGGPEDNSPSGISLDATGKIVIGGTTSSGSGFPTTSGAFSATGAANSSFNGYISEFSPDGHSLLYSTLIGGPNVGNCGNGDCANYGGPVGIGPSGLLYLGGQTSSASFPVTPGALVTACPQSGGICAQTAYLAAFDPTQSGAASLVFATYLTGTKPTQAVNGSVPATTMGGLAVDPQGNVYVTGASNAVDFPTTAGTLQPTCVINRFGACSGSYIAKISPTGTELWGTNYSTLHGNFGVVTPSALTLDLYGNVYVTGQTQSLDLQFTTTALVSSYQGGEYGYVVRLTPDGVKESFGAPYGGPAGGTVPAGIVTDASQNIYLAGYTNESDLTGTTGSFDPTFGGGTDGFVVKLGSILPPTQTTLNLSPSSATVGSPVTLTSMVMPVTAGPTPTGTVLFLNGTTQIGRAALNGSGSATLTYAQLLHGNYNVTAVYTGDYEYNGSSSAAQSLILTGLAGTALNLTTSALTANVGTPVVLTAKLTPAFGSATGTVNVFDGANLIGTATLNTLQMASLSVTLTGGNHSLSAQYVSDGNYAASTSNTVAETILASPVSVMLASSAVSATPGTAVTFTATVTGSAGVASGTVNFLDNGVQIGSVAINAQGVASFSTSNLAIGVHLISAFYIGSGTYASATSNTVSPTIALALTSISLASSASSPGPGSTVAFTATVTSSAGIPAGSVNFLDGATQIGTATLSGGVAKFSTTLALGLHSISAQYVGSTTYAVSNSNTVTVTPALIATTATLISSAPNTNLGASVTFTGTIISNAGVPTGLVNFYNGGTLLGSGSLGGGIATYTTATLPAGTLSVTAQYVSDGTYAASTSPAISEIVSNITPSAISLTSNSASVPTGTALTFTVQFTTPTESQIVAGSAPIPGGTVTYFDGTTQLGTAGFTEGSLPGLFATAVTYYSTFTTSTLSTGSHSITAVYTGDGNYAGSTSASLFQSVGQLAGTTPTSLALTSTISPSQPGQAVTLITRFTLPSENQVQLGAVAPTGTISFFDGTTKLGIGTVASGTAPGDLLPSVFASLTTSALANGTHSITAVYAGNATYAGSTSPALVQLVGVTPTVTTVGYAVGTSAGSTIVPGQTVSVAATVNFTGNNANAPANTKTPTGQITFFDGTRTLGTVAATNYLSSFDSFAAYASFPFSSTTTGTHSITAQYTGDSLYAASISNPFVLTVGSLPATVTTVSDTYSGGVVTVTIAVRQSPTASATVPTGNVTVSVNGTLGGTGTLNASGTATLNLYLLAPGTAAITAQYAGDANNAASTGTGTALTILRDSIAIALATSNPSVTVGQSVTLTASLTPGTLPAPPGFPFVPDVPTGTVTFYAGSTLLGSSQIIGSSTSLITQLPANTTAVSAMYSGNSYYLPSALASTPENVTGMVAALGSTGTAISPSGSGSNFSYTSVLSASGTAPTGTVNFTDNGTTSCSVNLTGSGTFSGGRILAQCATATTIATGGHIIGTTYSGDATYQAIPINASYTYVPATTAPLATVSVQSSAGATAAPGITATTTSTTNIVLATASTKAVSVTPTVKGLPAGATATFTNTVSGAPITKTSITSVAPVPITVHLTLRRNGSSLALIMGGSSVSLAALIVFAPLPRKRRLLGRLCLIMTMLSMLTLSSCGSTPVVNAGSYNIVFTVLDDSGADIGNDVPIQLVVQ